MSLIRWLLIITYVYIHLYRSIVDRSLIQTLVKFMTVKYNPSLISCNKVKLDQSKLRYSFALRLDGYFSDAHSEIVVIFRGLADLD